MDQESCRHICSLVTAMQQNPPHGGTALRDLSRFIRRERVSQSSWATAPDLARDTVEALKAVVKSGNPLSTGGDAAEVLGRMGPVARGAVGTIRRMLSEDENPENYLPYVRALARIVRPGDPTMASEAAVAFGAFLEVLAATGGWRDELKFPTRAREIAAEMLGDYGEDALCYLLKLLEEEGGGPVEMRLAVALWRVTRCSTDKSDRQLHASAYQRVRKYLHSNFHLIRYAVRAIPRMGRDGVLPLRLDLAHALLSAEDESLCQEIKKVLDKYNLCPTQAIADLIRRSLQKEGRIHCLVECVLSEKTYPCWVRCHAIEALGIVGEEKRIPGEVALLRLKAIEEDGSEEGHIRDLAQAVSARLARCLLL